MGNRAARQAIKYRKWKERHDAAIRKAQEQRAVDLEKEERKALQKEIREAQKRRKLREKAKRDVRGV